MPIERRSWLHGLAAALLLATASAAAADPAAERAPGYQPRPMPETMPQPVVPPQGTQPPASPAYQLEYRFRSKGIPPPRIIKAYFKVMDSPAEEVTAANIPATVAAAPLPLDEDVVSNAVAERLSGQPFSKEIAHAAINAALDPALVHAVIYVESRYRERAISPKGAIGLMQVMPGTAARYGIRDVGHSPRVNLKAGTLYLRDLMRMFDNRVELVLAAYNAGEGAVMKYSRQVPPYQETRQYVLAVLAKYNEWRNSEIAGRVVRREPESGLSPLPAPPVQPSRTEYLPGTRLVLSDEVSSRNY